MHEFAAFMYKLNQTYTLNLHLLKLLFNYRLELKTQNSEPKTERILHIGWT